MDKINASLTITRNGIANVVAMKGISYGKLVAVETALAAAQLNMAVWGVGKLAGLPGFAPTKGPWAQDISVHLEADFEGGGSASFSASWSGLSESDADEIAAELNRGLADVLK